MAKIFETKFNGFDRNFKFEFEWDDEEFVERNIRFDMKLTTWKNGEEENAETINFAVAIEPGDGEVPNLVIYLRNERIMSIPIDATNSVEEILDMIPGALFSGGEPITGCLIRSGLSVAISQIIECKNSTEWAPWYWQRIREIKNCLRINLPDMFGKFVARSLRCIIFG